MMLSDFCLSDVSLTCVCLSVAYIGTKSIIERPRKTKIGTEVAHVTRDSDTTFKVKGQGHSGGGILWRPPAYSLLFLCFFFIWVKNGPTSIFTQVFLLLDICCSL